MIINPSGNVVVNGQFCIGNTCINESDLQQFIKHGDSITVRSHRTGKRLQDAATNARFENHNRLSWEKMHIEKCGHPGLGHTPNNC